MIWVKWMGMASIYLALLILVGFGTSNRPAQGGKRSNTYFNPLQPPFLKRPCLNDFFYAYKRPAKWTEPIILNWALMVSQLKVAFSKKDSELFLKFK